MKTVGHCTLCDHPVFEFLETFPDGSPRSLGRPLGGARRVTIALADGTSTDLTFCADCEVTPETFPKIHDRMREAWSRESTNGPRGVRDLHAARPLDLRQQWLHGKLHLGQVRNVPVGVLYEETWDAALARESRG